MVVCILVCFHPSIRVFLSALCIICVNIFMIFPCSSQIFVYNNIFEKLPQHAAFYPYFHIIIFLTNFLVRNFLILIIRVSMSLMFDSMTNFTNGSFQVFSWQSSAQLFWSTIFIFKLCSYKFLSPDIMTKKYVKFNIIIISL